MDISPEQETHNHGRGMTLSKMMNFDKINYEDSGNKVACNVML